MTENPEQQQYNEEEAREDSRVDAIAIFAMVMIVVALASFFASR